MPALTFKGALSKGSDGGAATPLTRRNLTIKSYVGGQLIGVVGDRFEQHTVPIAVVHADAQREIISGASKTFFEGRAAARVDDPIADGDQVGQGNTKTFVE